MRAERTAWEKMTAIHVFCHQGKIKDQLSRHWYDIARLDSAGPIATALQSRDIAQKVADHKSVFFVYNDARGNRIEYSNAINGGLLLVPAGDALKTLEIDYEKMIQGRLFLHEPEPLEQIIERCANIQKRANDIGGKAKLRGDTA